MNKSARILIFGLTVSLFTTLNSWALSPPWYTLWNQIRHTIGKDPGVQVDPLDTESMPYVVNLRVTDPAKAPALAAILIPRHTIGNIVVDIRVLDSAGRIVEPMPVTTSKELIMAIGTALSNNELFLAVVDLGSRGFLGQAVGVTFGRSVVQFFNDDISELHGNYNAAAADVFMKVLEMSYGDVRLLIGTDTAPVTATPVLYAPHYIAGAGYQSALDLINLEAEPTTVDLTLVGDAGQILGQTASVTLPARATSRLNGVGVFGLNSENQLIQGFVRLQSAGGRFAGFVTFSDARQAGFGNTLGLVSGEHTSNYCLKIVQNDQYFTGLAAVNPGNRTAGVHIAVYDATGRVVAFGMTQIPPGGRLSRLLSELVVTMPDISRGHFQVLSTEPLACIALYGAYDGSGLGIIPVR